MMQIGITAIYIYLPANFLQYVAIMCSRLREALSCTLANNIFLHCNSFLVDAKMLAHLKDTQLFF